MLEYEPWSRSYHHPEERCSAMKKVALSAFVLALGLGTVALADHSDPAYQIKVDAPPAHKAKRGVAKIHIAPGAGFHFNKDYPAQATVQAPAGVTVEKAKLTAKDAVALSEKGAEFDVAYTPAEAGRKTFTGELKFAVCSASSCDPKKEKLSFTVEVK